ncbi:AI-2E family transporter [Dielma fastidiosa]|uniref:Putative PurR-regulated permease PerM n=1 Tax=Dielma fastidiosa TaxID=1034346 RepID=A0A318L6K2_9FIRM|nr:AI-2E family transporter [Dielma fastidiosa]PXX81113.1 putative PurR-regulated permease PerM [Dielma fastidiosa]
MLGSTKVKQLTVKNVLLIITYSVLLIFALINYQPILAFIGKILDLISPFFIAVGIAYVFNIPLKFYLNKLPEQMKYRKALAAVLALVTILLIFFVIIRIIAPQLQESIGMLIDNVPGYIEKSNEFINKLTAEFEFSEEMLTQINNLIGEASKWLMSFATDLLPRLLAIGKGVTNGIMNLFLALIIAVYMTVSKEKLLNQLKNVLYAFLPEPVNSYVNHAATMANSTFSSFISGQLVEAVIIGVLCYIGCLVLKIPYAPILAVVIGCTNIIPIFGPIIGTFVCAVLIVFVSPIKAVIFIVFGICLQQFESNLIYHKVVGTSVGLSGLWVLFAITLGGGLFGLMGMLLGLPTFAVLYRLCGDEVARRIALKKAKKADASAMIEQTE